MKMYDFYRTNCFFTLRLEEKLRLYMIFLDLDGRITEQKKREVVQTALFSKNQDKAIRNFVAKFSTDVLDVIISGI